ncbi:MAG: FkbM family methyltransferase [Bernardetiaceae bacterium]
MNMREYREAYNGEIAFKEAMMRYWSVREVDSLIIVDAGANKGAYSQRITELFAGLPYRLYAFEPVHASFTQLEQKLKDHPQVNLFNIGLGEKTEMLTIFANHASSELASLYVRDMNSLSVQMQPLEQVQIRNFSEVWAEQQLPKIHFLKIDTEGHELSILRAIHEKIEQQKIDIIQFEFGTTIESRTFMKDFFDLLGKHYRMYRLLKDGLFPLPSYYPDYEVFVLGNYIAVSRKINDFPESF